MTPDLDPYAASSRIVGISLLLTAKGMDLATTASVVHTIPGAESSPVPAEVTVIAGVPGLIALSVVICGAVIAVTEAAARTLRSFDPLAPAAIRLLAYGLLAALWMAVAVRNAMQVAGVLA